MKKTNLLFFVLLSFNLLAQKNNAYSTYELDSIKKTKLIYSNVITTSSSSTTRHNTGGGKTLGASAKGVSVYFRVGDEGYMQNLGKNGKNLRKVFENDTMALAELERAYVHLKKKRRYNTFEYLGYVVAVGSAVVLFVGLDKQADDGEGAGLIAAGGIGVALGFADIVAFHKLTDKEMNLWRDSIVKSIEIYNANILTKK